MADIPVFGPDAVRRIGRAVRWVEGKQRFDTAGDEGEWWPREVAYCRVTGAASGGLYPAVVTAYDAQDDAWADFAAVKLKPLNSEALTSGTRYPALAAGASGADDLYVVTDTPSAGGSIEVKEADGSPDVTSVTVITVNQAQGLRVTGTTGTAAMSIDDATTAQTGVVNTTTQSFTGDKSIVGPDVVYLGTEHFTGTIRLTGNTLIAQWNIGHLSPFIRMRGEVTASGLGQSGSRYGYLSATQLILGRATALTESSGVIAAPAGPGIAADGGGLNIFPDIGDTANRRAGISYSSPDLTFTLFTGGIGQTARFSVQDNSGTWLGAGGNTGGATGTAEVVGGIVCTNAKVCSMATSAPSSATATGKAGDMFADANWLYVCYSAGNWRRVALSTF